MPILDPVTNFAYSVVSTGYDASATSIALTTGQGARFPAPSTDGAFNLVWWNYTDYKNPADDPNREIVRVTARSTDTLTVTRAQEGTSASTKNTGSKEYRMMLAPTKKTRDDLENALAWELIAKGQITSSTNVLCDISSISTDYDLYRIRIFHVNNGSSIRYLGIRFNNDSGNNYAHQDIYASGGSNTSNRYTSKSNITFGQGLSLGLSAIQQWEIMIAKSLTSSIATVVMSGQHGVGSNLISFAVAGEWNNTSDKISRITIRNVEDSTNVIEAGSFYVIEGLKIT